jgi:hyperosmotically inducible protein
MSRIVVAGLIIISPLFTSGAGAWFGATPFLHAATLQKQNKEQKPKLKPGPTPRGVSMAKEQAMIAEQVRHRLVMLPYYDVFDWLEGEVRPDLTVVLRGEVVRPTTKSGAEKRTRDIESVTGVVNQIEVLPVSPNDDRLRIALYRAIYNWDSPLFRYATRAVSPIHIIVKNGRATLKGVVATPMDSQLAYTAARNVPGLFEVKNELQVEASTSP